MEVMVEFIMYKEEDFPVDKIIEKIELNSEVSRKGDVIFYGQNKQLSRVESHTSIMYSTGYIETINVKESIEKIYSMLHSRQKQIVEAIEEYNLYTKFCIVINLTDNPAVELSNKFINMASLFHSKIEFDSYVNYDKEGNLIR